MSQPIDFPWGSMEFACYPKINLSSFWKPNFPYTSHTVLLFKIDKLSLQRLCWALYNDTVLYCVVLHISWHNYTACNGWNHILLRDSFLRSSGHLASSGIRNWCHPPMSQPSYRYFLRSANMPKGSFFPPTLNCAPLRYPPQKNPLNFWQVQYLYSGCINQ